jgi:hypothetical protein
MSPFRISNRVENPRFRVTFDEDGSVEFCTSVKSLVSILRAHGRSASLGVMYITVGRDDRRPPYTHVESSFKGARIKRYRYPSKRSHPAPWPPNLSRSDPPAFLRPYIESMRLRRRVPRPQMGSVWREQRDGAAPIERSQSPPHPPRRDPPSFLRPYIESMRLRRRVPHSLVGSSMRRTHRDSAFSPVIVNSREPGERRPFPAASHRRIRLHPIQSAEL